MEQDPNEPWNNPRKDNNENGGSSNRPNHRWGRYSRTAPNHYHHGDKFLFEATGYLCYVCFEWDSEQAMKRAYSYAKMSMNLIQKLLRK